MRRAHTPPSTSPTSGPPPAESGGGPTTDPHIDPHADSQVDLVSGDPPVPITVWRTPAGDDQVSIPPRLAQRLVSAYSRPGEVIVDLTDDHALTDAAADGGRRHHWGWFTDASTVTVGPLTPPTATRRPARDPGGPARPGRGGEVEPPGLAAWFGDDLTDPDLPPTDVPAAPNVDSRTAGRAGGRTGAVEGVTSLLVACWPLHAVDARNRSRLAELLRCGVALLRSGGCLVLLVRPPALAPTAAPAVPPSAPSAQPEDFGPLVAAARDAGLGYLQHIVAVRAGIDGEQGDRFVYYATDDELLNLARDSEQWQVAHLRVHADLLVFTPPQPKQSGSRVGGGARG